METRRVMAELRAVGLVSLNEDVAQVEYEKYHKQDLQIALRPEFEWFLSEEFQKLKRGQIVEKEKAPPRNPILLLLYYSMINKQRNNIHNLSSFSSKSIGGGKILSHLTSSNLVQE